MLPDGSVNPGDMTSFNHYAFGAVVDWLHRTVAGLKPAEPGYRRISFEPRPGGGITHASARHQTPYGPAEIAWQLNGDELEVRVEVPPNARGIMTPPNGEASIEAESGIHSWSFVMREVRDALV
jgi:alpha-L-rhamnosidase